MRIIVIGAGASGMMAAISAARYGAQVTILESMEKPGKKLLLTGSGRCNLTNTKRSLETMYQGASQSFLNKVFKQFSVNDTLAFFHELGVLTKDRNDYIYPYTEQSSSILESLLLEISRLKVKLKCTEKVTSVEYKNTFFSIATEGWTYECDKVILAAGSKAAPATGSDGSGYQLAKALGHHIINPLPALVPLKTKESITRCMSGVRMPARLLLEIDDKDAARDQGEVQWTDYGVSGIVTFQISRFAVRALNAGSRVSLWMDLLPAFEEDALQQMLIQRIHKFPERRAEELFVGIFQKKVITFLLKYNQLKPDDLLSETKVLLLCNTIKHLKLTINGYKSYEAAQVCSGGIDIQEIDPETMESLIQKGFYVTGEILDIDGACGGYNLQWAWSSGYVAGTQAAREST